MKTMTQEDAFSVVKELEDRALDLLDTAKKIAVSYDLPFPSAPSTATPWADSIFKAKHEFL